MERHQRISEINKRSKFRPTLAKLSAAERQSIRVGTFRLLWDAFPAKLDLEGNVGNPHDPGDGKIYDERGVQQVSDILMAFYDAWSEATMKANDVNPMSPDTIHTVVKIPKMAKICLILRGMKQERLLDLFCENSKDDEHLPFKSEILKNIFDQEDADHAETFCVEQFRAIPRTWNDGEHIKICEAEPLPLRFIKVYGEGSYGTVMKYQHIFTGVFYACKEQTSLEAKAHLLREVDRLKKLGHRHIVQFVKSYQRGDQYGILLKPAATTDLKRLLDKYRRNGLDYDRDPEDHRRDRIVLKPVLLTAFGCLSLGLAHIHDCKIRHKDIKPANILYERALDDRPPNFLWADFGIAHDFGNLENSKTVSRNRHLNSPRYAAPEIMEEYEARKTKGELNYEAPGEDEEEGARALASGGSHSAQEIPIGHGRSSEIYSFGIVFLEILSHLSAEDTETSVPPDFENCMPFWKNTKGLQTWAHNQVRRLLPNNPLVFLFKLSSKMIAHNPSERPVISDVVTALRHTNRRYFCSACRNDYDEPRSQAVIAEDQMAEGLDITRRLSENLHLVNSREHGRIHEVQEAQQPLDDQEERVRHRPVRSSVYHDGKESILKRSSMRSPASRSDGPPSVLRFGVADEIISDVSVDVVPTPMDDKENHLPSIPSKDAI